MKLKQILFATVLIFVIFAGIFLILYFYKDSSSTKQLNTEQQKKLDYQVDKTQTQAEIESLKGELYRTQTLIPSDQASADLKLTTLGNLVTKFAQLDSKITEDFKTKNKSAYDEFIGLHAQAINEFIDAYEQLINNYLSDYLAWFKTVEARDLTTNLMNKVPKSLDTNNKMESINADIDTKISAVEEKLEQIDPKIVEFIQTAHEGVLNLPTDVEEIEAFFEDWLDDYSHFKTTLSAEDLNLVNSRAIIIFTEYERVFFNNAKLMTNQNHMDFALKYFPLSHQLLSFVEEKSEYDIISADYHKLLFKIIRPVRKNLIDVGMVNSTVSRKVRIIDAYNLILSTMYFTFFIENIPDLDADTLLTGYTNSILNCIASIYIDKNASKTLDFGEMFDLLILKSACYNAISSLDTDAFEETKQVFSSWIADNLEEVSNSYDKVLKSPATTLESIIKHYANSIIYNTQEFDEILAKFYADKLKAEIARISKIEDAKLKNIEYAKIFVVNESLLKILEFFKSPEIKNVNAIISANYNNETVKNVTEALRDDAETIDVLFKSINEGSTLQFAGFTTDFFNRFLLGKKGEGDITQELVKSFESRFQVHYIAYLKLIDNLKLHKISTIYDAMMFSQDFSRIQKYSLIDDMHENNEYKRGNVYNIMKDKNRICLSQIESIITIKSLATLKTDLAKCSMDWESWSDYGKVKGSIQKLKLSSSDSIYVQSGLNLMEDLLKNKVYKFLEQNYENQKNSTWINRATWMMQNFSLEPDMKNNIDAKIKILIK